MVWRTLKEVVPLLDERFRKTYHKFKEQIQGPTTERPRRKTCFSYTDNILGPLLGSLFVRKAFSPESKAKVYVLPSFSVALMVVVQCSYYLQKKS